MEGNAFDAYDTLNAPNEPATTWEEDLNQPAQIAGQAGVEAKRNQLGSRRALKATSRNVAKRLRTRQETRSTTKSSKTAEAAIRTDNNPGAPGRERKDKSIETSDHARGGAGDTGNPATIRGGIRNPETRLSEGAREGKWKTVSD